MSGDGRVTLFTSKELNAAMAAAAHVKGDAEYVSLKRDPGLPPRNRAPSTLHFLRAPRTLAFRRRALDKRCGSGEHS